jgi:hypothetical protein
MLVALLVVIQANIEKSVIGSLDHAVICGSISSFDERGTYHYRRDTGTDRSRHHDDWHRLSADDVASRSPPSLHQALCTVVEL